MFGSRWKKTSLLLGVCAIVLAAPLTFAGESKDSEAAKELTHLYGNHECPISGDPVDPATFAEFKDEENHVYGRIYTCCGGCVKKAEEKAAELYKKLYLTDMKTEKEVEPVDLKNEKCPISGGDVSDAGRIQYNGMIVGHCCDKCPTKFLMDPETNLAKLVNDEIKEKYELK